MNLASTQLNELSRSISASSSIGSVVMPSNVPSCHREVMVSLKLICVEIDRRGPFNKEVCTPHITADVNRAAGEFRHLPFVTRHAGNLLGVVEWQGIDGLHRSTFLLLGIVSLSEEIWIEFLPVPIGQELGIILDTQQLPICVDLHWTLLNELLLDARHVLRLIVVL